MWLLTVTRALYFRYIYRLRGAAGKVYSKEVSSVGVVLGSRQVDSAYWSWPVSVQQRSFFQGLYAQSMKQGFLFLEQFPFRILNSSCKGNIISFARVGSWSSMTLRAQKAEASSPNLGEDRCVTRMLNSVFLFVLQSNRSLLLTFSREYLKGEGDVTKHLNFLGYSVTHSQVTKSTCRMYNWLFTIFVNWSF